MDTKGFALAGAGKTTPDQGGGPPAGEANVGVMTAAQGVVMEKSFDLSKVVPGAGEYRIKLADGRSGRGPGADARHPQDLRLASRR